MSEKFNTRISFLPTRNIVDIYHRIKDVRLNNVLEGFDSDFLGIMFGEKDSLETYELIYVGNSQGKVEGLVLHSGQKIESRDLCTVYFSRVIENEFPKANCLAIFNTFQNQLKSVYENFGVMCVPNYIANLKDVAMILPSQKGDLDNILFIDIHELYKSYFERENYIEDKKGQQKVYLMYDRRENLIKIGETQTELKVRRKGVAEQTLRASDPMIEVVVAWKAPKSFENDLLLKYSTKRIRGEWFDIRAIDLENINIEAQKYQMIEIDRKETFIV